MISLVINDKELKVEEGTTVLEAALAAGIKIPTLCYHKELTPYGACRLCLIEIVAGGRPGLETACLYKATEGLAVKTDTERVKSARKIVFELLLARCPDSDRLNALAREYGVTETRIRRAKTEPCMLCGLCVRACAEVVGRCGINFAKRGIERKVQTPFNKIADVCIGCGACAYLCPMRSIEIEEA